MLNKCIIMRKQHLKYLAYSTTLKIETLTQLKYSKRFSLKNLNTPFSIRCTALIYLQNQIYLSNLSIYLQNLSKFTYLTIEKWINFRRISVWGKHYSAGKDDVLYNFYNWASHVHCRVKLWSMHWSTEVLSIDAATYQPK